VRGPGLRSADLSLQKQFPFGESKKLEFRAEFFNVTNSPMLNIPYTGVNFKLGIIDRSQGERNIQFALKFYFSCSTTPFLSLHRMANIES
jgi:hypothetical protein